MKKLSTVLLALIFGGKIFAADSASDFSTANRFYAEGKFAEAAQVYQSILQSGAVSPALLFNYGDAEFKCGHLGLAIAAYRKASLLAPRDAEIRANLQYAGTQVHGLTRRQSWWENCIGTLTLNEGAVLTAVLFWLTFALLVVRQIRPALVPKLKNATRIFAALTIFAAAVLGLQAANHFSNATAIVVTENVTARSGPFDDAQKTFAASDGAELTVLDRREGWVQVADGAGKTGWLQMKQVEILPGA